MSFLPGPMELVIILVIVAMLFGVGRLPEVFGAVGRGIREFRNEVSPTSTSTTPPVQQSIAQEVTEAADPQDINQAI